VAHARSDQEKQRWCKVRTSRPGFLVTFGFVRATAPLRPRRTCRPAQGRTTSTD
jgi:hypothetical protein